MCSEKYKLVIAFVSRPDTVFADVIPGHPFVRTRAGIKNHFYLHSLIAYQPKAANEFMKTFLEQRIWVIRKGLASLKLSDSSIPKYRKPLFTSWPRTIDTVGKEMSAVLIFMMLPLTSKFFHWLAS